jgi:hypothetical protein
MNEFKSWEEMSTVEQYACQFWDMYKDAYGFRPRGISTHLWDEDKFNREFDFLQGEITKNEQERKQREFKAEVDFEMRVQILLGMGADDREMALRWIHEAEETGGDDEYLCYTLGLPYRYFAVDKATV